MRKQAPKKSARSNRKTVTKKTAPRKTVTKKAAATDPRRPILYAYTTRSNISYAFGPMKKKFGSVSAYVTHLISRDRGRTAPKAKTA